MHTDDDHEDQLAAVGGPSRRPSDRFHAGPRLSACGHCPAVLWTKHDSPDVISRRCWWPTSCIASLHDDRNPADAERAGVMTLPREVIPGRFYMVTRRCKQRQISIASRRRNQQRISLLPRRGGSALRRRDPPDVRDVQPSPHGDPRSRWHGSGIHRTLSQAVGQVPERTAGDGRISGPAPDWVHAAVQRNNERPSASRRRS